MVSWILLFPGISRLSEVMHTGRRMKPDAAQHKGVSRMGRGRQKAKHTKLARELKSFSPSVDYRALERELAHPDDDPYVDRWADQYADEDEDEDELEKA